MSNPNLSGLGEIRQTVRRQLKMPPANNRVEILAKLKQKVADGRPIIGGGAGIGLTAKSFESGGGDLIIIYNSGRFRMAGRGSLAGLMPYGNANDVVVDMGKEILPIVSRTPVLAGVCASDPFRMMPKFLAELKTQGFAGIQNFPTVGLIDGQFRENLEETGMSYALEVDMVAEAHKLDMLTAPYAFNAEESLQMAKAGADIIVAHMGLTTSGTIGAKTGRTLEECVGAVQQIRDAAVGVNEEILVLCHGGPIAEPGDAKFILERCKGVHGFFGASSVERLPTEKAISGVVKEFTDLRITR